MPFLPLEGRERLPKRGKGASTDFRFTERGDPTRFFGGGRARIGESGPIIPLDEFAEEAARRVRRRLERNGGR